MSQPSVTAYFNSRKRQATDELKNKAKVLILDRDRMKITRTTDKIDVNIRLDNEPQTDFVDQIQDCARKQIYVCINENKKDGTEKVNSAVRNIQFDGTTILPKTRRVSRTRVKSKKPIVSEGEVDIMKTFLKITHDKQNVVFKKKGLLSPKKNLTPKDSVEKIVSNREISEKQVTLEGIVPKTTSLTDRATHQNLTLDEIKNRINKSSRLAELKKRIDNINKCEKKLHNLLNSDEPLPQIKKFEKIQLEVPISPQKSLKSPLKTPVKKIELSSTASPQRRLLFSPKESTPSPVKCSPTKAPAYQRYQSIGQSGTPALPLPFSYRFLAETFRCVDLAASMLFNRKETITFRKLKPPVQELLRHNLSLEHLSQIKSIYPDSFNFSQEKIRNFGSTSKQEKYELVITPIIENITKDNNGRNSPNGDNILKMASDVIMGPSVILERRRKLYNALLERTKMHHETFLLSLENPLIIPKEKITRWHPEFNVDNCPNIELAELPQLPNTEKASSAKDVLERAKTLFNCNTRMEKALQRLADAKMTSKSDLSLIKYSADQPNTSSPITVEAKTPGTTSITSMTTSSDFTNPALKGIPKALLERVRAKQTAKALEAMTRTPTEEKEAIIYARLPELAKILRNIFVAEKKCVLILDFVIDKLDNSYRTKLTSKELEDHIRLMCKLLPTWATIHHVRQQDYLKIAKDVDIARVVKKYEIIANDKLKT
ncbi:DNA replication factor Cdt1 [Microplitis mediator]|uniref:DNA replication factor Cdt1 n=1 Tax=Microplitis mediator TaxID=375433 RepID=UPI002557A56B|nr:DNA replication factor Cdt1 [Microplitis mediator]